LARASLSAPGAVDEDVLELGLLPSVGLVGCSLQAAKLTVKATVETAATRREEFMRLQRKSIVVVWLVT